MQGRRLVNTLCKDIKVKKTEPTADSGGSYTVSEEAKRQAGDRLGKMCAGGNFNVML